LDLVEELGRIKPKTVSEQMEVANRFADGGDAYHSKRACSPKHDKSSRQHNQRRISRNEDGRTPRNQITAGCKRRDGEGDERENDEYREKTTLDGTGPSILTHQQKTSFTDPAISTMHIWMAKGFLII
jgi:hypothetical protein